MRTLRNPIRLAGGEPTRRYAEAVAAAYEAAPLFDPQAVTSFLALRDATERLYRQVCSQVQVKFVPGQPYADERTMRREVQRTGVLKISSDFKGHAFLTPDENLRARAVHDWIAHTVSGSGYQAGFGQRGELSAYNRQAKMVPVAARPALFTEVVGQAMTATVSGAFPVQKIAVLPGFDYENIGLFVDKRAGARRSRLMKSADYRETLFRELHDLGLLPYADSTAGNTTNKSHS